MVEQAVSVEQVVSAIPIERGAFLERPQRVSVREGERRSVRETALFERSEFAGDSVVFRRSSEAGAALNFWLLFFQEKSNNQSHKDNCIPPFPLSSFIKGFFASPKTVFPPYL